MKCLPILFFYFCISCFSTEAQDVNLERGLIAHYLFNGDVLDNGRYKNNGVMKGGLLFGEDRFGSPCGALQFNGADSYVWVASSQSLTSPNNELSVATWFALDGGATDLKWLTICCKSDLIEETPESPQYRIQGTRSTISINTEFTENLNINLSFNTWYHYAVIYDGVRVKAYLNGVKFFNFPYSSHFLPNDLPLEIGRDLPGNAEYYSGKLDDLRIYNRAINEKELLQLYQDESEKNSKKPCVVASGPDKKLLPPQITILQPLSNPHESDQKTQKINARIKNISNRKNIQFKWKGEIVNTFKFNPSSQLFSASIVLEEGDHLFEISATNETGRDRQSGMIKKKEKKKPPLITMINPASNPYQTSESSHNIKAEIKNISSKKGVIFRFNGKAQADFNFRGKSFSTKVKLESGFNLYEIKATNQDGSAMEYGQIVLKSEESIISPQAMEKQVGAITVKEEIEVHSGNIELVCFDHLKEDGDIVSIFLNGEVILDKVTLKKKGNGEHRIKLPPLVLGKEYLIISKAWNLGKKPPNTLTMELHDGLGKPRIIILKSEIGKSEAFRLIYRAP